MPVLSIIVPGPWWHPLSYTCENLPSPRPLPGARVKVPLGNAERIGFFLGEEKQKKPSPYRLKNICCFMEHLPLMGGELWSLALWMAQTALCAPGIALKTMLPEFFFRDIPLGPFPEVMPRKGGSRYFFRYEGRDSLRYDAYTRVLAQGSSRGLFIFPEMEQARSFWGFLASQNLQDEGLLWNASGNVGRKKKRTLWESLRRGEFRFVVGALGAVFAPLPEIDFFVLDHEGSRGYLHRKTPFFHVRPLLVERGKFFSSALYFGGRMPSSRVFLRIRRTSSELGKERPPVSFRFVSKFQAMEGISRETEKKLPLSKGLLSESAKLQQRGGVALWLLDRNDGNRELFCSDCGYVFTCASCGGTWVHRPSGECVCSVCGTVQAPPSSCPRCRGRVLSYKGPGIRSLYESISALLGSQVPCYFFDRTQKTGALSLKELKASGGIVVGTRKSLALCDKIPVSLVAWLDADAEARKSSYYAQEQAFRMVWESCWRGIERVENREVFLQSGYPEKGWQKALKRGWFPFWEEELRRRRMFGFPPYGNLIEVTGEPGCLRAVEEALDRYDIPFALSSGEKEGGRPDPETLWIKSENAALPVRALQDVFCMDNSRMKRKNQCSIRMLRD